MDILDGEDLLEAEVIPLQDLRQRQPLQLLQRIFLLSNH
jgi:hypothetical protein